MRAGCWARFTVSSDPRFLSESWTLTFVQCDDRTFSWFCSSHIKLYEFDPKGRRQPDRITNHPPPLQTFMSKVYNLPPDPEPPGRPSAPGPDLNTG